MAYKYFMTHTGTIPFPRSWAKNFKSDNEGRCPDGKNSIWIECNEYVTQLKSLKRLQEILAKENTVNASTVMVVDREDDGARGYFEKMGWTWVWNYKRVRNGLHGFESDVSQVYYYFNSRVLKC